MTEQRPFKEGLDRAAVRRIARSLQAADSTFPDTAFVRSASRGLSGLELKARVLHVAAALRRHLPEDMQDALRLVVCAGEEHWDRGEGPLAGFAAWPLIEFVGEYGLDEFDASLDALRRLTRLFSAEFAIRPFIERYPQEILPVLRTWTQDPDEHVRRLVSEGTRPRLPWGRRLRRFQEDPTETLELLELLIDDPALYVRRSVANHVNDIAKDHPARAVATCSAWLEDATPEREWVVRHATRTLVKAGHAGALELLGYDPAPKVRIGALTLSERVLTLGEDLGIEFDLRSTARRRQRLVIDYAVHYVKQDGTRRPKVFKLKTMSLAPGGAVRITKRHKLREISTRRHYRGCHAIEILVNGASCGSTEFELRT